MSMNSAAADQVTRVLQQRSDIRLAILFGSVAQGTARPDSDEEYAALIRRHIFDRTDFLPYRERLLEERAKQWIGA